MASCYHYFLSETSRKYRNNSDSPLELRYLQQLTCFWTYRVPLSMRHSVMLLDGTQRLLFSNKRHWRSEERRVGKERDSGWRADTIISYLKPLANTEITLILPLSYVICNSSHAFGRIS